MQSGSERIQTAGPSSSDFNFPKFMKEYQLNSFESIDLCAPLRRALAEQNYKIPTPIQAQAIPPAIRGRDILGCAETGTGKTAAFAIPILNQLSLRQRPPKKPMALVLVPTRELAIQISNSFESYGKYIQFRKTLVYGGVRQNDQVDSLRRGTHIVIATPGRLLDLLNQRLVDLSGIEVLVLDEADRMLDMGFLPDLKRILELVPDERQSLFFSATMPPNIRQLSERMLVDPVSVNVAPSSTEVRLIEQSITLVESQTKVDVLHAMLSQVEFESVIVFTRTKHGANALANKLDRRGIRTVAIHGNKAQNARQRALTSFRQKRVSVLVATDVAARGIDIDGVTHVINFDMPDEAESYVHRIGRTGRAGNNGIAISYCKSDELDKLRAIERLIGNRIRIDNPQLFRADATSVETKRTKNRRPPRHGNRSSSDRISGTGNFDRRNADRRGAVPKSQLRSEIKAKTSRRNARRPLSTV